MRRLKKAFINEYLTLCAVHNGSIAFNYKHRKIKFLSSLMCSISHALQKIEKQHKMLQNMQPPTPCTFLFYLDNRQ